MKRLFLSAALLIPPVPVLNAQDEPNAFRRFDINLNVLSFSPWFHLRAGQVDYDFFRFQGTTLDGIRVGGGVVFRMGKPQ